jgi:hypothetical protein
VAHACAQISRGEASEEEIAARREKAMADPQIQAILTDPVVRQARAAAHAADLHMQFCGCCLVSRRQKPLSLGCCIFVQHVLHATLLCLRSSMSVMRMHAWTRVGRSDGLRV